MLQYLNQGGRTFGANPMTPHARLNWEFYAVLGGQCAPVLPGQPDLPLRTRVLWAFAPWQVHGWRGEPGRECQVVCFHFAFVPAPLDEIVRANPGQGCDLTVAQGERLQQLARELRLEFERPTRLTHLRLQIALLELTLLALGPLAAEPLPEAAQSASQRVDAALAWFSEHLAEAPTIETVARNVHVSPSHLRRLFMVARQESPQTAFKRLRLQRVMELLSETSLKLETIAAQCGYANSSDLCRAFRNEFHISPGSWRQNDYRTVPGADLRPDWLGPDAWALKKRLAAGANGTSRPLAKLDPARPSA